MLWGEKEREKSGVSDKTVREEGFVEELVFEQRPEVRGELLRWSCTWKGLKARQGFII